MSSAHSSWKIIEATKKLLEASSGMVRTTTCDHAFAWRGTRCLDHCGAARATEWLCGTNTAPTEFMDKERDWVSKLIFKSL